MDIDANSQVGAIVGAWPATAVIFERFDINYSCQGSFTLQQVCQLHQLSPDDLLHELAAMAVQDGQETDWRTARLSELANHLVSSFHCRLRADLPRIDGMFSKVLRLHIDQHAELQQLHSVFTECIGMILPHMLREERIIFPAIVLLEKRHAINGVYGSLINPINALEQDHLVWSEKLREMERLTNHFELPADACNTYWMLFRALTALFRDFRMHLHLEANILFPRAFALEQRQFVEA